MHKKSKITRMFPLRCQLIQVTVLNSFFYCREVDVNFYKETWTVYPKIALVMVCVSSKNKTAQTYKIAFRRVGCQPRAFYFFTGLAVNFLQGWFDFDETMSLHTVISKSFYPAFSQQFTNKQITNNLFVQDLFCRNF